MKTDKYYELLKASPLSMPYDKGTIEEVAIWFDMNCTKTSDVIKMLKAIERNYHNYETDTIIETRSSSSTFSVSSTFNKYGFNPNCPPSSTFLMLDYYFSDNMLYWLFKVITETDSLNNIVLNKKFFMFTINHFKRF